MDKKKMLPVVLVMSIAGETLLPVRHSDILVFQPHREVEITAPFANTMSPVSTSGVAGGVWNRAVRGRGVRPLVR